MALLHALRQASWTLILPMQMGASPYWALLRGEANMLLPSLLTHLCSKGRARLG